MFFWADRKRRLTFPASDLLRHLCSTSYLKPLEWNVSKLDRKQDLNVLYQVCCFRGRWKKRDGRPSLWLAETFTTSSLKLLNGICRNVAECKSWTSFTKFVVFGPIRKNKMAAHPLIDWHIFDYSSGTAEWSLMKLDKKQDLNVLYQVCSWADRKTKIRITKITALADPSRKVAHCT